MVSLPTARLFSKPSVLLADSDAAGPNLILWPKRWNGWKTFCHIGMVRVRSFVLGGILTRTQKF